MSRARRLAEIAKANEPAFTGAHWWLADPSAKPDPVQQAPASEPSGKPAELVGVAVHAAETAPVRSAEVASFSIQASHSDPEPVSATEPVQNPPILASKMTGLREKFLWLGRRNRGAVSA